jgi:hypothetical protein
MQSPIPHLPFLASLAFGESAPRGSSPPTLAKGCPRPLSALVGSLHLLRSLRQNSAERNSNRATTMRPRHPPKRGIMSPKMRSATERGRQKRSRQNSAGSATEYLRRIIRAQVTSYQRDPAAARSATYSEGALCRRKCTFATEPWRQKLLGTNPTHYLPHEGRQEDVPAATRSYYSHISTAPPSARLPMSR